MQKDSFDSKGIILLNLQGYFTYEKAIMEMIGGRGWKD
jgi:hypothetical protein